MLVMPSKVFDHCPTEVINFKENLRDQSSFEIQQRLLLVQDPRQTKGRGFGRVGSVSSRLSRTGNDKHPNRSTKSPKPLTGSGSSPFLGRKLVGS